ncbi:hypothetical protein BCR42DRAFT_425483 [Absidia repens]|uniref:Transmembrane protein n=1 Tax=Absidia repens TaxID=90262 RepID=A0A1X2I314_9FUNG|nr:hypothetical protein BCR42DRAFT_425483 [Absidia repens]
MKFSLTFTIHARTKPEFIQPSRSNKTHMAITTTIIITLGIIIIITIIALFVFFFIFLCTVDIKVALGWVSCEQFRQARLDGFEVRGKGGQERHHRGCGLVFTEQ